MHIQKIKISGAEVYPVVEGGKGIGVSNGHTAGAFAASGAVGTISGVFTPEFSESNTASPLKFEGKTREERSRELIRHSINNSVNEVKKASEIANGKGRIHLNVLWGISSAEYIIEEILKRCGKMLHGVTCGAGMPYNLGAIASKYETYYYPIISSARAFSILYLRAYKNYQKYLGGVVYEDPWKAGGHNGLSNKEDALKPEGPYERVKELRKQMNKNGLQEVPIIFAGGIWSLERYREWTKDKEIAPVAFQIGTRPLRTKESPVPNSWKDLLLKVKKGDVEINKFSPTGFHSSAYNNSFLKELKDRATRQIPYQLDKEGEFNEAYLKKGNKKEWYIKKEDLKAVHLWEKEGFSKVLPTPDKQLLFITPDTHRKILKDRKECKGCLAECTFSSWSSDAGKKHSTGRIPDPRTFCIFRTLENVICTGDVDNELVFLGHNAPEFSTDNLNSNGRVPSIDEMLEELKNDLS